MALSSQLFDCLNTRSLKLLKKLPSPPLECLIVYEQHYRERVPLRNIDIAYRQTKVKQVKQLHDISRRIHERDPLLFEFLRFRAFLIYDSHCDSSYSVRFKCTTNRELMS